MAEALEHRHLVDQHRVAEVQVGRRGVEPGLDTQRPTEAELLLEVGFQQDFRGSAAQFRKLFLYGQHRLQVTQRGMAGGL